MIDRKRWICILTIGALTLGITPFVERMLSSEATAASPSHDVWKSGSFPVEKFQGYTSPFGYRVSPTGGYTQEFHSGLDFAAPEGAYIRNWWNGRVISVSDDTACGTSVRIQSGSWIHVYCHMKGYVGNDSTGPYVIDQSAGIKIHQGDQVVAGQRIGRVGMTGRTTGPHLHWTLKYEGKFVDPAIVLRTMYTAQSGRVSSVPQ